MLLELIAEFYPFLKEHIKGYGNAGSCRTSYLSKTVCYELIEVMVVISLEVITAEVKTAEYYSPSVDSTLEISHMDQLSFIIQYINEELIPQERFLKFIPNPKHKAETLIRSVTLYRTSTNLSY